MNTNEREPKLHETISETATILAVGFLRYKHRRRLGAPDDQNEEHMAQREDSGAVTEKALDCAARHVRSSHTR